jgi:hypothetical protein
MSEHVPATTRLGQSEFIHDQSLNCLFRVGFTKVFRVFGLLFGGHLLLIPAVFVRQHLATREALYRDNHPIPLYKVIYLGQFLLHSSLKNLLN